MIEIMLTVHALGLGDRPMILSLRKLPVTLDKSEGTHMRKASVKCSCTHRDELSERSNCFMDSVRAYLLCIYYMPGTDLGTGNTVVNKKKKNPSPCTADFLVGEVTKKIKINVWVETSTMNNNKAKKESRRPRSWQHPWEMHGGLEEEVIFGQRPEGGEQEPRGTRNGGRKL